jgi:hypothetical protein
LESHILEKEEINGIWREQGNLIFNKIEKRDIPLNPTIQSINFQGQLFLFIEGTQQLYFVNLNELIFKRYDSSYYRGYNFGAIRFSRKDTIHSVGGGGFWHSNNIETFFSSKSKEWELYHAPSVNGPLRVRSDYGGYDQKRDVLSVIELAPLYQLDVHKYTYRYFEKYLNNKGWTYKGDLNVSLLRKLGVDNLESVFIQGIYLFRNGPYVVMADPVKNELYQIDQVIPMLNETFELSEKQGYIYSYHVNKHSANQVSSIKVDSISIAQLKSLGKYKGEFYVKPVPLVVYQIGFGLILLILGFFIGFWVKKSQKTNSLVSNTDSEFSILDGLPDGAYEFLKASLALPKGHHFSSQAFTELMGFSSYAYETQRQVRSKLIKAINAYFSIHYRMQNVIIRKTANDDKRFSIYYISEDHYEKLKELLGGGLK